MHLLITVVDSQSVSRTSVKNTAISLLDLKLPCKLKLSYKITFEIFSFNASV